MRLDEKWLEAADKALRSTSIVEDEKYRKPFKGYFSSYGAAIVQSGLLAASVFFEDKSESAQDRTLVVKAVVEVLREMRCIDCDIDSLAFYYYKLSDVNRKNRLLFHVDKTIAALKQALRQYREQDKDQPIHVAPFGKAVVQVDSVILEESEFKGKYDKEYKNDHCNMGWLYYRNYYRQFNFTPKEIKVSCKNKSVSKGNEQQLYFQMQNDRITALDFKKFNEDRGVFKNKIIIEELNPTDRLYFETTYPGLLIGSGLSHGTGVDNDMKIGFAFDYTTGLPYIPGSSVKGVLRSMFPEKKPSKAGSIDLIKYQYIKEKLSKSLKKKVELFNESVWQLTCSLFEEYQMEKEGANRTIYFDALITEGGRIMGDDFITPHTKGITKNPTPLQFLKVLPQVTFCFPFKLAKEYCVGGCRVNVPELFKLILQDTGVGAKTNVGYGNLHSVKK